MTTLIKTTAIAALLTGFAATAQAADLHVLGNNPDVNATAETIVNVPNSAFAVLDPSTQFDINGDAVIHQRSLGSEFMATSNATQVKADDPFVSYDINGRALPSR